MSDKLSPLNERRLAELLADINDPGLRQTFEAKLRKRFARSEQWEEAFNAAYGRAVALGIEDCSAYAERAAKLEFMERISAIKAANIRNAPLRMETNSADRSATAEEAASKTARPDLRRLPQRDRHYLEITGSAERAGRLAVPGLVETEIRKTLGRYRLPHWEKTTLPLKVAALSLETARQGGRTINLRIGSAVSEKALASDRGPVSFIQNQVRETLRRRFADDAPDFWFVMERDSGNLFHLHGAYVDQPHIDSSMVDNALRDAGGWSSPRSVGIAQMSAPLEHPLYWAFYTVKRMNLTSTMTDRKLLASTARLRDAARGGWEAWRSELPSAA